MQSHWTIWVDAKTPDKAGKLLRALARQIDREAVHPDVQPYPKTGGHRIAFDVVLAGETWNDAVVELISLGQCVGYDWQFAGNVLDDAVGRSAKSRIAGVQAIEWQLRKE